MHSLSVIVFSESVARLYRLYIISAQSVQESPKLVQVCWQSSHHFPSSPLHFQQADTWNSMWQDHRELF